VDEVESSASRERTSFARASRTHRSDGCRSIAVWKIVFMEQRLEGTLGVWAEPFVRLRLPKVFNLRTDPYEFAPITSNTYYDWMIHNGYFVFAAQTIAAKFAATFKEFPSVQRPNSFTIDDAMKKMQEAASGSS
jgi:arylsulfatase